jgi:hypothetical protein
VIDLDHYAWRERVTIDGEPRLLIPCADPERYEEPADGIFSTVDEAVVYLELFGFESEYDPETWVLVHYVGTVVPTPDVTKEA